MNRSGASLQPVIDNTLRAQIVRQLRDMITGGAYAPGERLTETKLAEQLHVSRAPLREAIRELVDVGILVSQPYRGLFVRSVSIYDINEIYSMRTVLEQFAFKIAWDKRTKAALDNLRRRYDRLLVAQRGDDQAASIDCEISFHSWIYELSDHSLLLSHWERLVPMVQIYMSVHHAEHGSHGWFRDMTTEYLEIATSGKLDQILEHIEDHMQVGLEALVQSMQRAKNPSL